MILFMSEQKDPRVLFAAERTLLAWSRTSIALIAFGFLVERTGIMMKVISPERQYSLSVMLTFWVGMLFILVGAISATYSSRQYSNILKTLNPTQFPSGYGTKWGMVINLVVAMLGFFLAFALFVSH